MKDFDPELMQQVEALLATIAPLWKAGKVAEVEAAYRAAWDLVPDPKHQWRDAQWLTLQIFDLYFLIKQPEKLLPFLPVLEKLYPDGLRDGTVAINHGMTYFELNRLDEAFTHFDFLFKSYKARPFQGRDKKYLDFYVGEVKKRSAKGG